MTVFYSKVERMNLSGMEEGKLYAVLKRINMEKEKKAAAESVMRLNIRFTFGEELKEAINKAACKDIEAMVTMK